MKKKLPSPRKLPSGMWRVQITVDGKRISVTDENPAIAQAKAVAMRAGIIEEKEKRANEKSGSITLSKAIDLYIESRENVLSPSTIHGYKEIQRNRFQPLMKQRVKDIDEMDIQGAINQDAKTVSAKTIKNALGLVVSVLAEYKQVNIKRIRLPQRRRKEHTYLDEAGMINLFEAIQDSPVEIPILLAVWLGMRRSEILGLCWDSIDFKSGKIIIKRTYVKDKEKGYVLRDEMKTEASMRTLDCPGYILKKLAAYTPNHREGRVFTMHPNTIYKTLKAVCDKNGIDFVGVHGLRHTNASVMLSLGVVDKVAMARGGWSTDVTMKQIYQHVFQSDKETAKSSIDTFFQDIAAGINPSEKNAHEIAHEQPNTQ